MGDEVSLEVSANVMSLSTASQASRQLTPESVLERLHHLVSELPHLNDPAVVKEVHDQAEAIRFLTRKLQFDTDIQNQATEACLWTKRRLGELLPSPRRTGRLPDNSSIVDKFFGDDKSEDNRGKVEIVSPSPSLSGIAREIGLPQVQASRLVAIGNTQNQIPGS